MGRRCVNSPPPATRELARVTSEDFKTCTKCGEAKPATTEFFYPHKTGRNGLSPHCKVCNRKIGRAWADENRDRINAQNRAREKDPERERQRQREWRQGKGREKNRAKKQRYLERHPERVAEARRAYVEKNRDKIAARTKAYREARPDYRKNHPSRQPEKRREYYDRYRARQLAAYVEDVSFDVIVQRDCGLCGICGLPAIDQFPEIDHIIPLSRGGEHSYANTQLAHRACNRRKHARLNPAA